MLAYLEGRLLEVWGNSCIVLTQGGVGYEVALPSHTLAHLPEKGEALRLFTSFAVREDAQELYGFESWEERRSFQLLISISKVGAKTALAILSLYRPEELRRLVMEEDVMALTRVSGIGKKTAQHILLELRYKFKAEAAPAAGGLAAPRGSLVADVLSGLSGLGYQEEEAAPVLQRVLQEEPDLDVSGALRATLKNLARGR